MFLTDQLGAGIPHDCDELIVDLKDCPIEVESDHPLHTPERIEHFLRWVRAGFTEQVGKHLLDSLNGQS